MTKVVNITNNIITICGVTIKPKENFIWKDELLTQKVKQKIKILDNLGLVKSYTVTETFNNRVVPGYSKPGVASINTIISTPSKPITELQHTDLQVENKIEECEIDEIVEHKETDIEPVTEKPKKKTTKNNKN